MLQATETSKSLKTVTGVVIIIKKKRKEKKFLKLSNLHKEVYDNFWRSLEGNGEHSFGRENIRGNPQCASLKRAGYSVP